MTAPNKLSRKSIEVLELMSLGMTTIKIARQLRISPSSTHSRIERARRVLGADNRTHAVALAMAGGLIDGPEPVPCTTSDTRALADFVEDYKVLRGRGMTHVQIAEAMGYKRGTVGRRVSRAREVGLLPPPGGGRAHR